MERTTIATTVIDVPSLWDGAKSRNPRKLQSINEPSELSPSIRLGRGAQDQKEEEKERDGAPEKMITLFAMRAAIVEKLATKVGTLAFIWATVVLLGGFATALKPVDFWMVTGILLVESSRIFSRSNELQWQHEISLDKFDLRTRLAEENSRLYDLHGTPGNSAGDENQSPRRVKRTWTPSTVRLIPLAGWLFVSKNVSNMLLWVQIFLAMTCVALSLFRLATQSFSSEAALNGSSALNVFYATALGEALLFLTEKAYWEWKIVHKNLIRVVNEELGLEPWGVHAVRRFFYDAYARSINGSIFDGLKMDFLSFAVDLFMYSTTETQSGLTGARILSAMARNPRFAEDTLRSIGGMRDVGDRLIEMLCWTKQDEEHIRLAAAEIVFELVRSHRNCVRVAAIEGCLESISSLLYDLKAPPPPPPLPLLKSRTESQQRRPSQRRKEPQKRSERRQRPYDRQLFTILGLNILNSLARDHENCSKIGGTRGLLTKIVDGVELRNGTAVDTVQRSLRLLTRLASSTGNTGKQLRQDILDTVFTVSNIRDLMLHCSQQLLHSTLLILSIDTLNSLALEHDGRLIIGATGGVLSILLSVFFEECSFGDNTDLLVSKAGEALALLALDTKENCEIIASAQDGLFTRKLASSLGDVKRGIQSARILRSMWCVAGEKLVGSETVIPAAEHVLALVVKKEGVHQLAAIGLAARMLNFFSYAEIRRAASGAGMNTQRLMETVMGVLMQHRRTNKIVPDLRRFCVEFIACVAEKEWNLVKEWDLIKDMRRELHNVLETTSDIENYVTFSGGVGLSRHHVTLRSLVTTALSYFSQHFLTEHLVAHHFLMAILWI